MPRYIIEREYLMPVYQHLAIEAADFETACREAMDESKHSWNDAVDDPEGSQPHYLTNAVEITDRNEWHDALLARANRGSLLFDNQVKRPPLLRIPEEFTEQQAGSVIVPVLPDGEPQPGGLCPDCGGSPHDETPHEYGCPRSPGARRNVATDETTT